MNKKAIILCRGASLEQIKNLSDERYDLCVIVNDWKREVQHDYVSEFLHKQNKIIHYVCRESSSVLTKELYEDYNIDYVYLNVLRKEYEGCPPYRHPSMIRMILDSMNVKSKPLENTIMPYSEPREQTELRLPGFPTMGVLTTCHVPVCLGYKDVTVVGLDFYEAEYLTVCSSTLTKEAPKKSGIDKAPRMKRVLTNIIEKLPEVTFKFYTYSTYNPNLSNVQIFNERAK